VDDAKVGAAWIDVGTATDELVPTGEAATEAMDAALEDELDTILDEDDAATGAIDADGDGELTMMGGIDITPEEELAAMGEANPVPDEEVTAPDEDEDARDVPPGAAIPVG
jgi:hypothetical protein